MILLDISRLVSRLGRGPLTGIDRVKASGRPVILLGASNFGERLDAALVRPGRFDRLVPLLPPSTTEEIGAVFRYYLKSDLAEVDLVPLALLADGATPAAIEAWVKQARRSARRSNRPLALLDLTEAVAPKGNTPLSMLEACAVHEAGHAVIAHALGIPVRRVTIVPTAHARGTTTLDTATVPQTRGGIETLVMVGLAVPARTNFRARYSRERASPVTVAEAHPWARAC